MNDNFRELAEGLMNCWEEMYNLCYPEVERIIKCQIKDINVIEYTLDMALDIYTNKGFDLFIKLLLYYKDINYQNAKDYLEILKNDRSEEYDDFVKKLVKK